MDSPGHIPVLLREVLECLQPQAGERAFDGTVGGAGHASAVASCLGRSGMLVGVDRDSDVLAIAERVLQDAVCRIVLRQGSFEEIEEILQELDVEYVDLVLLDLGISSFQLDCREKGFSFRYDAPLDMRMDLRQPLRAVDIVNETEESELAWILAHWGEERFARRIAREIVRSRLQKRIETTFELRDIVVRVLGNRPRGGIDPATRTFQAIRIAVNDELNSLQRGLEACWRCLATGGRMAVICFHSLEDRIVKQFIHDRLGKIELPPGFPVEPECHPEGVPITKKPIRPSADECHSNPRSSSARLRAIKKVAQPVEGVNQLREELHDSEGGYS